jgi:hypothetical protein
VVHGFLEERGKQLMLKFIIFALFLALFNVGSAQGVEEDVVVLETEGSYVKGVGDSKQVTRGLALFDAKRQAVESAGRYLAKKGLIEVYEMKKDEIYNIVAEQIEVKTLEEKCDPVLDGVECAVRIRARVKDSDFISAEKLNRKLELEDLQQSFREEMGPTIPKAIEPGMEIARAYRLLRRREWRRAIIYLDRLETKYPHWHEVHMAKAIGYYVLHEPVSMMKALEKACRQGNKRACNDLETIKRVHDVDIAP